MPYGSVLEVSVLSHYTPLRERRPPDPCYIMRLNSNGLEAKIKRYMSL